jgi:hypothetical protein
LAKHKKDDQIKEGEGRTGRVVEHVAFTGGVIRSVYMLLVRKPEGRPRRRWKNNTRMDIN